MLEEWLERMLNTGPFVARLLGRAKFMLMAKPTPFSQPRQACGGGVFTTPEPAAGTCCGSCAASQHRGWRLSCRAPFASRRRRRVHRVFSTSFKAARCVWVRGFGRGRRRGKQMVRGVRAVEREGRGENAGGVATPQSVRKSEHVPHLLILLKLL